MAIYRKLLLIAGCLALGSTAGTPANAQRALPRKWEMPSITALLGQRERLGLTPEQVAALDSVNGEWTRENDRITPVGTVMTSSPLGVSVSHGRPPTRPRREALANDRRAAAAVEALLTAAQREAVCAAAASSRRREPDRLWPWCLPVSPAAPTP